MRKSFLLSLLLALLPLFSFAETYFWIRIQNPDPAHLIQIARLGIAMEEGVARTKDSLEMIVNDRELRSLRENGFSPAILNSDMEAYFRLRITPQAADSFATGSMGGFFTYDETIAKLHSYQRKYPNLIALKTIGSSLQGRAIVAAKISDNAGKDERDEPEALYTGLLHAREPESLMCVLYFMEKLLKNYGKDPEITYLVDHRQLWFIPIVNPDGYVYNQQTNPGGGGLWRKNRRDNGNGTFGVDLNRNFGYTWGIDDAGSSPNPGDDTYRGTAAFSEPETQVLRDFALSRRFRICLNYHAFSDVLVRPWEYQTSNPPDLRTFKELGSELTSYTGYPFGSAFQVLHYTANGNSDDWLYGDVSRTSPVFAMTAEVGAVSDNFWPSRSRIIGLARENYRANLALAWMVGGHAVIRKVNAREVEGNGDAFMQPGEKWSVKFTLRNIGLTEEVHDLSVVPKTKNRSIEIELLNTNFGDLKSFRSRRQTAFLIDISGNAQSGHFNLPLYIYSGEQLLRKVKWGFYVYR